MNRFRATLLAATVGIAAVAAITATTSPVAASADPFVGMQVLDKLCQGNDGLPVNSPYAIGRCQAARSKSGFEIEQLICEGLLDGTFIAAPSTGEHKRTTWACIAGSSA